MLKKNRSVLSTEYRECLKISSSIVEKRDSIIEDIRNYLQTLENNYATKKP